MGESLVIYAGAERGSYNGSSHGIGYGKLVVSKLGCSRRIEGVMEIGSYDGFSGGNGDGKLEAS